MRMLCAICGEFIAIVEPVELRYPVTAAMFHSPDSVHEYPDPFTPGQEWESMRCPYGRTHRAMVEDNVVLTHKGVLILPKDGSTPQLFTEGYEEVGRNSLGDRILQIPDDVAERQAREDLGKRPLLADEYEDPTDTTPEPFVVEPGGPREEEFGKLDPPQVMTFPKPITGITIPKGFANETPSTLGKEWICLECGKVFEAKNKLQGHMGAHKAHEKKGKKR